MLCQFLDFVRVGRRMSPEKLKAKHQALKEKMLKLQAAYTKAVRDGNVPDKKLRTMADNGFAAEIATMKAWDAYQAALKKK